MTSLTYIINNIITSSIIVGILGFLGSTILKRYVDSHFKKKEESFKRQTDNIFKKIESITDSILKTKVTATEALFNKELSIYPEITEIVYRCRNLVKELDNNFNDISKLRDFSSYAIHLNENIYKYRIFFSNDAFRKIHRFKTEVQEISILLNEVNRSTQVEDSPVNLQIREYAETQLKLKFPIIDKLYKSITSEIQKTIAEKTILDTQSEIE